MSKRGLNLHKRKDGRWEGRYLSLQADGTMKYHSVYGHSFREAKEKLLKIMIDPPKPPTSGNSILFQEVLNNWLSVQKVNVKGATERKYRFLIDRHIIPDLGKIPIEKISPEIFNHFLREKQERGRLDGSGGLSAAYLRGLRQILVSAVSYAADTKLCQAITSPIQSFSAKQNVPQPLSLAEQNVLEQFLLDNPNHITLGVLLSLRLGLRIGEVCALRWEDFDLDDNLLHIQNTVTRVGSKPGDQGARGQLHIGSAKTAASRRTIPLPHWLMPVLSNVKKTSVSDYVISTKPDFLSPRTFEYRFHRLLDQCGLRSVNYHTLRHSFATRCIENGMDVKTLSELLGHSNVSITLNIYVHSSIERKRTELERIIPPSLIN